MEKLSKNSKKENKNYIYIRNFNKIKLSEICKKLKLSRSSVSQGSARIEDFQKVKEEIESEIAKLYIKE